MGWTPQQQKAIECGRQNASDTTRLDILVSAAAGSGKTAVLTSRIAKLVAEDQIPLKKILVVTFTEAAASEMKERIALALEAFEASSDFVANQIRRIDSAKISTFHSFCYSILRRHFHEIGLDPSFSVCDELRARTLKEEAMMETLEESFSEYTEFFRNYAIAKDERNVQAMVMKVFEFIMTLPEPFVELEKMVDDLYADPTTFRSSGAMRFANDEILYRIRAIKTLTEQIGEELISGGFPSLAEKNKTDLEQIAEIETAIVTGNYKDTQSLLSSYKGVRFDSTKAEKENGWNEIKDLFLDRRDRVKKTIKDLHSTFYARDIDVYETEIREVAPFAKMLVGLVRSFDEKYKNIKQRENVIDYSDFEHMALKILDNDAIADDYRKNIEQIYIDEYQDSNYVQDALIKRISRGNNVFMVGDVKQSIYKFRNAEPAIFLEKLGRFSDDEAEGSCGVRINLSANFRSKAGVIKAVNAVFENVMDKRYCGLDYTDGHSLDMGLDCGDEMARKARIYLVAKDRTKTFFASDAEGEAFACVKIINELIGQERFDAKKNCTVPIEYRDIVILRRNVKSSAEQIVNVLGRNGIPAFTDKGDGYFDTIEIDVFLDLLKTVMNLRRDVPLAASLCSSAFGFNLTELADIRLMKKDGYFYEAFLAYAEEGEDAILREKCVEMNRRIANWRNDERFMPLDEFLWKLMRESGHYDYAGALPNGEQRRANLRGLLNRARDFQKGRVRGLRAFVAYLERVKDKVAVPQEKHFSENENVVRIMTVHSSKGLEFPVVIQCGVNDYFSRGGWGDAGVMIHKDAGLSLQWEDRRTHIYKKTLPHHAIRLRNEIDERAEEIRLLYVSMTRAMDVLCLVGTVSKPDELLDRYENSDPGIDTDITGANSYLGLILPTVCARRDLFEIEALYGEEILIEDVDDCDGIAGERAIPVDGTGISRAAVAEAMRAASGDQLSFVYPYAEESQLKAKYSVTELAGRKHEHGEQVVFYSAGSGKETDEDAGIAGVDLTAAEKGTVLHKVFELLDFSEAYHHREDLVYFEKYLKELCETGVLTDKEASIVSPFEISRFAGTDLCRRAGSSEMIMKEVPFNMRLQEKGIMVQGVIDLLFKEADGIVVADYKSGHFNIANPGEEERIRMTYGEQVSLYRHAVVEIFNAPVKEALLYMTKAGVCVRV